MALKSFYADASEVPEALKSEYTESADGRYVLDIEDVDNHPKVRGVIGANRENAQKAKERLARVEELTAKLGEFPEDFDPGEWARLKSGAKPDEQINAIRDQHTKAVEALKAKHATDLNALAGQVSERDSYIDGQTRRDALLTALDAAGFDPAHKDMLAKYLGDNIKVRREDNGARVAFAETDLGDISPLEFAKDFAAKQGKQYLAKAAGPGGAGSGGRRTTSATTAGNFGGTKAERVAAIEAKFAGSLPG